MGLCLYVLEAVSEEGEEPEEIAECDVGHYSDFACFRNTVALHLDVHRFPLLMQHSDCEGDWKLEEIPRLERELEEIGESFKKLPPMEPQGAFEHAAKHRQSAASLYDCFHDVNGDNLFKSLLSLCAVAREHQRPITFM